MLKKAEKKIFIDDYTFSPNDPFPPLWSLASLAPIAGDERAEDAFWSFRKDGASAARKRALADPWWAYAVAVAVDRAPKPDTRAAASKSPVVASLYASDVDRGADPVTRKAAFRNGLGAMRYQRTSSSRSIRARGRRSFGTPATRPAFEGRLEAEAEEALDACGW